MAIPVPMPVAREAITLVMDVEYHAEQCTDQHCAEATAGTVHVHVTAKVKGIKRLKAEA